jgi:hypothetical protein
MSPDRDVVAEETVVLRAEVREALAAWEGDVDDYELERAYFDKMDRLDHNLAERGLERGEDIDEELPLREFQEQEQSTPDKIREAFSDHNEDGMIRFPWFKDRAETSESSSPNWTAKEVDGRTVYYRTQGEAVVWKDRGRWAMDYAVDPRSPTTHADLGRTRSVENALNRADLTIMSAQVQLHQSYEDVRTVVNLAREVEDITPTEQGAIDRLQEAIDQGPPPEALDPAEDWLEVFDHETQERDRDRDNDKGQEV